ncbi:streptogrisin C [Nocardiopsis mwathae]|uniref:Streptogrisin C n=1 Tax=Nocardiopsis mwathae TaxID=1472723 RepID=A0A7W9YJQ1_9ACTN|nr:S1 family peptidase [Nocardiopsis mwathae]MBB6173309.1 streptogrisin C [Nocardiopsis mwathae]
MRTSIPKSPLVAAIGSGALALGLITAPGAAAGEPSTPAAPPLSPDHLQALHRDLGLDPRQAAELSPRTDAARNLESAAREAAGAAFAGAVFDIGTGALTVGVTDRDAADAVDRLGAATELVEHSEDELRDVKAGLDGAEDAADDAVTGWYLDPADNTVVVTVLDGGAAAAADLVEQAGVDADAVTVEEVTERPRTLAGAAAPADGTDIQGGDRYYYPIDGRPFVCSVGFGVEGGYVTAGHCGAEGEGAFQNTGLSVEIGRVAGSEFPGSDMGWVRTTGDWSTTHRVNDHDGGSVAVAGAEEAPVGAAVCRSGATTGWRCGTIRAKDETVRYEEGAVKGLTRTDVCADGGDSGGPWVAGDQAQGVTSGGTGTCRRGGTSYVQPLAPVLEAYDLTLLIT